MTRVELSDKIRAAVEFLEQHSDEHIEIVNLKTILKDALPKGDASKRSLELPVPTITNWNESLEYIEKGYHHLVRFHYGPSDNQHFIRGLVAIPDGSDVVVETVEESLRYDKRKEQPYSTRSVTNLSTPLIQRLAQYILSSSSYEPNERASVMLVPGHIPDFILPQDERLPSLPNNERKKKEYLDTIAEHFLSLFGAGPLTAERDYWGPMWNWRPNRAESFRYTQKAIKKVLSDVGIIGKGLRGRVHLLEIMHSTLYTQWGISHWERAGTVMGQKAYRLVTR